MKAVAISDMHSMLNFKVPKVELLLIAGDLCPAVHSAHLSINMQHNWLDNEFRKWINEQPVNHAIAVSGNHDWIWEVAKDRVPWFGMGDDRKFEYIEDELIIYKKLKIYGTPVQLPFNDWAFNRDEESIQKYWDNIPTGLDILLLHCPPYGILDETHHPNYASEHIGSKSLLKRIKEVRPRYVIFGHNHGEHGAKEIDGITYVNASLVDEEYKMVREPIILEIEEEKK